MCSLHKKHYDLGVVRSAGSVQAVFKAGTEWEAAARLILAFIKSKAPSRGEVRSELCPRWVPPKRAAQLGERKSERRSVREAREKGGDFLDTFVCQTAAHRPNSDTAQAFSNLALPRSDNNAAGTASVAGVSSSSNSSVVGLAHP